MPPSEEEAMKILLEVAAEIEEFPHKIDNLMYREDYQDFVVLLNNNSFTTIRQKLIETFHEDKTGDIRREIQYRLKTAEMLDEDDIEAAGAKPDEPDITVEDDSEPL